MKQRKAKPGPAQHYPALGGAMVPITVYLPPNVLIWAKKQGGGAGETVRRAVLEKYTSK